MEKQQVLDVLNELEAFEIGAEGYALVEINDDVVLRMNGVGVLKEDLEQYGDKDENFCKWAFAFDQGYANKAKADGTLIWEEREGEEAYRQAGKNSSRIDDEIERYILMRKKEGKIAVEIVDEIDEKAVNVMRKVQREGK